MRVLIIEDDPSKAKALTEAVEAAGVASANIHVVPDSMGAKEALKSSSFDVFIVDLHIPRRFGGGTEASGGPELLRWFGRRREDPPEAILAVTSFDPDAETAAALDDMGVVQVRYRLGEDKWQRVVTGQVQRVRQKLDKTLGSSRSEIADFVVLTTVDVEFEAVQRVFALNGSGELHEGETWHRVVVPVDGEEHKVVVAQATQMGMPAAAVLTAKAIRLWKPRNMLLVGICAGVRGEAEFGDIIVPDPAWDYGSGKLAADGILSPDPRPVELREPVRALLKHHGPLAPFHDWRNEWPAKKPSNTPKVICKPAASGAAVLADGHTVDSVKKHSRKLVSVEMEAYGFYYAASHSGVEPAPRFASIKAVVDFADGQKSDDYQEYGAFMAAKLARWLVERPWPQT